MTNLFHSGRNGHRYAIAVILLLTFFFLPIVSGNPIVVEPGYFGLHPVEARQVGPLTIAVSFGALFLEFLVLRLFFRADQNLTMGNLAWMFLKIHLLSFPLTQVVGMAISFPAEIIPIFLEYYYYQKVLGPRLSNGRIFLGSLVGNLVSYFAGVLVFNFLLYRYFYTPYTFDLKAAESHLLKGQ